MSAWARPAHVWANAEAGVTISHLAFMNPSGKEVGWPESSHSKDRSVVRAVLPTWSSLGFTCHVRLEPRVFMCLCSTTELHPQPQAAICSPNGCLAILSCSPEWNGISLRNVPSPPQEEGIKIPYSRKEACHDWGWGFVSSWSSTSHYCDPFLLGWKSHSLAQTPSTL